MDLTGIPIIVLDLETAQSADDCKYCGKGINECTGYGSLQSEGRYHMFDALGWLNKPALGLSIGCWYDYRDGRIHWFDRQTLEATVQHLVDTQPLLVSFNGVAFDFPLMRGLLRQRADALRLNEGNTTRTVEASADRAGALIDMCDTFKRQCAPSYDILRALWDANPGSKMVRGLNSLDAIAQANGLGAKIGHGAQAPRDWRDGQYAKVLNYCQSDVYLTKALFELILTNNGVLLRGNGVPLTLPLPVLPQIALDTAMPTRDN
jgi:hypothetical protein